MTGVEEQALAAKDVSVSFMFGLDIKAEKVA